MAQTGINLTEGSGKRTHGWDQTISATLYQDQFVIPGEFPLGTYTALTSGISAATTNDHAMQIMSGSSTYARIRRIYVRQAALAGAANTLAIAIFRLTTAGSGGTSVTPRPLDSADSAASSTAMTLPSSKGTEGVQLDQFRIGVVSAQPTNGDGEFTWEPAVNAKGIVIPTGVANGIALKILNGVASLTLDIVVTWVETSYAV